MQTVLVANRGEIALRIMRACREERLKSVAIVTPDEGSPLHSRYADEAVTLVSEQPLGYLDIEAVLRAATESGADAIHPGYGFLAENARFAQACEKAGFVFIGPSAEAISSMGDKVKARAIALRARVPLVPGSDGPVDAGGARAFGDEHGYPIALKASAGGGGRGFRVARSTDDVDEAFAGASGEAERYFGDPTVYVERYLERPRHVEIQIMADSHGNVLGLGERDCSIQRRHQKLIEESPSPVLDEAMRTAMNETAERLAKTVGYVGAGTVEFLVQDDEFFFLEMNTRVQVEHPVTEEVTGIDIVREGLRVAAGKPLSFSQRPELHGHAIECRINAEDPGRNFAPTPGTLTAFSVPAGFGVRVDTGFEAGAAVDPRFDNLIAKFIVWGRDRREALSRLERALDDFEVGGVATTIPLYKALLRAPEFASGDYDTGFLERSGIPERITPFEAPDDETEDGEEIVVKVNGRPYSVTVPPGFGGGSSTSRQPRRSRGASSGHASGGSAVKELKSPIQGTVLSVGVESGATVEIGQLICVVEAMKMENEITAHRAGVVSELNVAAGQSVKMGETIAVIDDAESE
ncbi:MAG: ATP-grasp domain-containing protein [Chloroflexia bacterium]|nr:ATP-grasp domain-containing protein [Chloroflexia bacterium]